MRIFTLTFLSLFLTLTTYADTGNPVKESPAIISFDILSYSFSNIFFEDAEAEMLFVDFDAIEDDIQSVKLLKNNEVMMEDNVTDLPGDTIYEFTFEAVRAGKYTIELTTTQDIKIRKDIIIE